MKDQKTNAEEFQNNAKNWLTLFLTPSEVHHISEFMAIYQKYGGRKSKSSAIIEILEHEN
ncbi:hypothetical protein RhiirB3_460884 [Rhizophagus irregularis]|nr:hypothetical protein RhiirB3_460884 [Rhizophagus irregularis]